MWTRAGEEVWSAQSGKAKVLRGMANALVGEKKKNPAKGPVCRAVQGRAATRSTRADKASAAREQVLSSVLRYVLTDWLEYAVWYTCNNVGGCRSWEVATRGEWPSGRVTTDWTD